MPDARRSQITQLTAAELDRYTSQLARCLKALGTLAPIRADVQRELAEVWAEQDTRASANRPGDSRSYDVSGMPAAGLERTRRELAVSLALARPDSPARVPIQAQMAAIDAELAARAALPEGLPGSRPPDPGMRGSASAADRPAGRINGHSGHADTRSETSLTECLRPWPGLRWILAVCGVLVTISIRCPERRGEQSMSARNITTRTDQASSCYFRTTADGGTRKALVQIDERCNLHCALFRVGDQGRRVDAV